MLNAAVEDLEIAKLYKQVQALDLKIAYLAKASFIDKAQTAELVLHDTRDAIYGIVLTLHSLKNDLSRIRAVKS